MSCTDNVCGIGSYTGPKPGDPNNDVTLSANAVFGGINVSWSYPTVNPHAVAYTTVYRGTSNDFAQALVQGVVGGSIYFDKLNPVTATQYYYWIAITSSNGTTAAPVGPASAIARPIGEQTIEELSDRINNGVLAQALKEAIARIPVLDGKIIDEVTARIEGNQQLANAFASLNFSFEGTQALLQQEITRRVTADDALVQVINSLTASLDSNGAALLTEQTVRATKDESLAQSITVLQSKFDDNAAAITAEQTARTTANEAMATSILNLASRVDTNASAITNEQLVRNTAVESLASDITILYAKSDSNAAAVDVERQARIADGVATASSITALLSRMDGAETAIQTEQSTRATNDTAIATSVTNLASRLDGDVAAIRVTQQSLVDSSGAQATQITNLSSQVNGNTAAIQQEATTRSNAVSSLASQIDTTQSTLNGNIASVQTSLQTKIDTTNGQVSNIGALYTAKVNVNGLVGGFGVYNNGSTVEAGFDVSTFWIGSSSLNAVKPFIVDGGTVFIDKARIRNADIDSLKLAGEAVTVPVVSTAANGFRGTGENNYVQANEGYFQMDQAGMLYVLCTSAQGFYNNSRPWRLRIKIDGNVVRSIMGGVANDAPCFSASLSVGAGVHRVQVEWAAHSDVLLGYCEIFMMGVKR